MATLTLRLDREARDALEDLAKAKGETMSDLVRREIDALIGRDVEMQSRSDVPPSLSMQQRHALAQQHELRGLLARDPGESEHHQDLAEVLTEGYAGEYDSVFASVRPELSRAECSLVWDILDMFRILEASIESLSEADRQELGSEAAMRLRFAGFDLNDSREGRLLSYVRYLIRTDRWIEIEARLHEIGDRGNSHHPCLPGYERMLSVFRPILQGRLQERGVSPKSLHLELNELKAVAES